jgi:two-component system, NtrC family, sensor kinase
MILDLRNRFFSYHVPIKFLFNFGKTLNPANMRKILLCLFLLSVHQGFSQSHALDSLKKLIDNDKQEDSVRVNRILKYGGLLARTAISSPSPDYTESIYYLRHGILLANKINRPDLASDGYIMISRCYNSEDKWDSSIAVLLEGLGPAERLDLRGKLPIFYHELGEKFRLSGQLTPAEFYIQKYYDMVSKQKNDELMLRALNLFVSLNLDKGNEDTIRILLDRALMLAKALKNKYYLNRFLRAKGEQYYRQKKYPEAVNAYHEANINGVLNTRAEKAYLLTLFSKSFLAMNNKDSAAWYAHAAVDSAVKYKLKKELADAHGALYNYHNHFGEYKQALEERLLLDSIENKLDNSENGQTIVRAQMKYEQEKKDLLASIELANKEATARKEKYFAYGIIAAFILLATFLFYNNRQKQMAKIKIENAYSELKTTQAQLVQSEKMASLGELTAGIAHEIQNPLNFVNNFSDVNAELLEEASQLIRDGKVQESLELIGSITDNEKKINHHGRRADAIVKGMLQHSRSGVGVKEPTDINALASEYLRLSYQGLRAKDKLFNARLDTDFDPSAGLVQLVPQDIGRVLLNMYNNAFYAVMEKKKSRGEGYEPVISLSTKKINQKIIIKVKDNGDGIPLKVQEKIFQPFFTTKPTGQGTGLGLSLSYDIVKAHGGEIRLNTSESEFTEFVIQLPA